MLLSGRPLSARPLQFRRIGISILVTLDTEQRNTFLIVENDANDAFLIHRALQETPNCGTSVVCRNPGEAKAYLLGAGLYRDRHRYPFPDVVITDINMGGESGIELVDWVRKQAGPLKDIKVVILTGSASQLQFDAAEKVGAQGVYRKPNRLEDLQEMLLSIAQQFCPKQPSPASQQHADR
jgi:CheY-like chemotaxis protein